MKKYIIVALFSATFMLLAFTTEKSHIDLYKLNTQVSSLDWVGEKLTGTHSGTIQFTSGSISNNHGTLTASFEVDMTTISCTDLEGKSKEGMDGHLKSDDFFGSVKYPKATFVSTSFTPIKDAKEGSFTHTISGSLTIKDKTNEISFDAIVKMEAGKIGCIGTAIVDRSKFDIKYGSKTFNAEIGDKMIYDEFKLKFNVIAVK